MAIVDSYDGLLLDIDGVVRLGDEFLPGAVGAIGEIARRGIPYAFVTNSPRLSPEEHAEELREGGIEVPEGRVVTAAGTLVSFTLGRVGQGAKAVVVGTPSFHRQIGEAGIDEVDPGEWRGADVVLVSGHDRFDYRELRAAAMAARAGALLVATGRDPTMPMPDGLWPGTGSILAAIETASGVEGTVTGKPAPALFEAGVEAIGRPGRVAMVGDRIDTDVAGARAAGLDGILVSQDGDRNGPKHVIGALGDLLV